MPLPRASNAPHDFDFMFGDWTVRHRRLDVRLAQCDTWTAFDGRSSTTPTLGGCGNLEDNLLHFPEGDVRAVALRAYDPASGNWSIWWLDGRNPTQLDVPVVGQFSGHVGLFFADDVFNGVPIRVRFTWTATPGADPLWEQAFSQDGGASWETNWTMTFTRVVPAA